MEEGKRQRGKTNGFKFKFISLFYGREEVVRLQLLPCTDKW